VSVGSGVAAARRSACWGDAFLAEAARARRTASAGGSLAWVILLIGVVYFSCHRRDPGFCPPEADDACYTNVLADPKFSGACSTRSIGIITIIVSLAYRADASGPPQVRGCARSSSS
jgi:hypothetical protein